MGRLRLERQVGGLAVLVGVLSLCFAARAFAAEPIVDLRGEWVASAMVGSTTYPQTLHITSEDFTTGQIGGTDAGADGSTYTLVGQISGTTVTMTISNATYQSKSSMIISTGPPLRLSGTFSDTNHNSGTFTASLSVPATPSALASSGSTVTAATATISVTADVQAATVTSTPPADSGPTNELPLIAIGVAAVLLVGLGAAAVTGLLPGTGLGGSGTGSGGGQAGAGTSDAATPAPSQQIERAKVQQDVWPSTSPIQHDIPARHIPAGGPDAGPDPAGQASGSSGQQIERAKVQQDVWPSTSPIQQDIPPRHAPTERPDTGPDPAGQLGTPPNTAAPPETIGPASAVPTDAPPTA